MNRNQRILLAIAALLLGLTFIFPLWNIGLWAPQYPEGLSLHIWTSHMAGDIKTVNILNHYIGMKPINPSSIPELLYFPKIITALIVLGVLAAVIGKKQLVLLWTFLLLTFCVWSFHDFYSWEYAYGHDLLPDAALKMEGESYQPPLIGEKQILSIVATSYPDVAGVGLFITVFLACSVSFFSIRKPKVASSDEKA